MIQFKHILCPIDFSDISVRALAYAAAVARWYEARLEVLHIVPGQDAELPPPQTGVLPAIERVIAAADAVDTSPLVSVSEGPAHERIAERARAQPADLLVMGTHGRSGFNRLLLGSVAEKVLRSVTCPVLTVPPALTGATASKVNFTHVLCAIDYSPSSLRALQYALELGRQAGGKVTVLHALEYLDPDEPCEHVDFDIRARRQYFLDSARESLHAHLAKEPSTWCDIDEVVATGRAYKVVLQRAAESKVDLIVMGAQGTAGLELMVYGSNTQHVLRAATCPVLTVHA